MKNIAPLLLMSILSIGAFSVAAAPDQQRAEKRMGKVTQQLNLSEQQQQQFREITESYREKKKALREEKASQINAILTAEQRTKFEQMREQRKAKREERRAARKNSRGQS